MKLVTTDNRVLDVHVAGASLGFRLQALILDGKDFTRLNSGSDEQKLQWITKWMIKFPPIVELEGSSQITDRKRIKELEKMLSTLVPETEDLLDCVHSEFCGFKCKCADSTVFKLIIEAKQLFKKQAGFEDDKVQS